MEEKYLIMVEAFDNHNKFYRMVPNADGQTWTAVYGRVGAAGVKKMYDLSQWDKMYNAKVKKGYQDVTNLHAVSNASTAADEYDAIPDSVIRQVVESLLRAADQVIKDNYKISPESVNYRAIRQAQDIIDRMVGYVGTDTAPYVFNRLLDELFTLLPRRMSNVIDYRAERPEDYKDVVEREQKLLDVMASRVNNVSFDASEAKDVKKKGKNILEAFGLEIRKCSIKEKDAVKSHLDAETQRLFKDCYHVVNKKTRAAYEKYVSDNKIKNIRYLYHGSRNENYWSILINGLKLRPSQKVTRAGAMFGYGLYFAPKAKKSCGYTSLPFAFWSNRTGSNKGKSSTAYLTVFKVAMGKEKDLNAFSPTVSGWYEKDCKKAGFQSVYAHAGKDLKNDECIVYNEDACTISYLVELAA